MKVGQTFGIGRKDQIDLWCSIESIDHSTIEFYVINGNWYGQFQFPSTVVCYNPMGNHTFNVDSFYWHHLRKFGYNDYNEAIQYMDANKNNWGIVFWYDDAVANVKATYERLTRSIRIARKAFTKSWTGIPTSKNWTDEDNDDIAF